METASAAAVAAASGPLTSGTGARHGQMRQQARDVQAGGGWQTGGFRQKLEDCMKQSVTTAGSGQSDWECATALKKAQQSHTKHTLNTQGPGNAS